MKFTKKEIAQIEKSSEKAAAFLSGLANPHRLRILCQLADGEKSVTELIDETGIAQTSMSQHLNKLKDEEIVHYRREHRTLIYFICDPLAIEVMAALYKRFCKNGKGH